MPSRTSASPSPPPAAPQTTSSDPGPRATALKKIYTSAIQSTLKANSYQNFAACFPTPAKYCPTALEGVWRQLNTRLEEECIKDFGKILEERKAVEGLDSLDLLTSQAAQRRDRGVDGEEPVVLYTLSAQQLGEARMHGFMVKSGQDLEQKLSTTQQDNLSLMEIVRTQREEIQKMVAGLESLVGDIDGAVKALEEIDGEEMRKAVWSIEQEMKDTR